MTFPLLRLPLLASIEVIKNTDVKYLIPLIHISKKAKNLVKASKVHVKLTILENSIQFQKRADQGMVERLELFVPSENPTEIPFKPPCQHNFDTKIQYQFRGYKKLLDDFLEFFKVCSVSFDLKSATSYTSCCYMEYANGLGLKVLFAQVVIAGYSWFTVDHMCALVNCSEVFVKDLYWSNGDFNRLIKFWMASDGNLKSCTLYACRASIIPQIVMYGINYRQLEHSTYEIQRADGVKAEVALSFSICTLKVIDA